MKPSLNDVAEAVELIGEHVPLNFPRSPKAVAMIVREVQGFVNTREELNWLTVTAFRNMERWSLKELRGIFCSRFKPADGIEERARETPGFTTADAESRYMAAETAENETKRIAWRKEYRLMLVETGASDSPVDDPYPVAVPGVPEPSPNPTEIMAEKVQQARDKFDLATAEKALAEAMKNTPKRSEEETQRLIGSLAQSLRSTKTE